MFLLLRLSCMVPTWSVCPNVVKCWYHTMHGSVMQFTKTRLCYSCVSLSLDVVWEGKIISIHHTHFAWVFFIFIGSYFNCCWGNGMAFCPRDEKSRGKFPSPLSPPPTHPLPPPTRKHTHTACKNFFCRLVNFVLFYSVNVVLFYYCIYLLALDTETVSLNQKTDKWLSSPPHFSSFFDHLIVV